MTRVSWVAAGLSMIGGGAAAAQDPLPPAATSAPFDYDQALAESGIDGSYGYFRTLDGSATLVQPDGERLDVQVNEPVLVGDRLFVSGRSRAELVLADRNVIRLGDGAEAGFRALAYSGDSNDAGTVIELARGTIQVVVVRDQLGRELPTVVTPNASVHFRESGLYLVVVDGDSQTEIVVRNGRADVFSDDDGAEVRAGEAVFARGRGSARLEFAAAPSLDRLEAWGDDLGEYQAGRYAEYVDDDLHYAASGLDDHGTWVDAGGGYAWRPYVSVGWSPYRHGRWRYTPSGLFWVSYEPWGWVPYHYGYWDYVTTYGWVWYPGRRFAPAHVYWYWGQRYAGWVPIGYYARHYGRHYGSTFGFYFGVYGTIGGGAWDPYRRWTFIEHGRFGHRRQHQFVRNGFDLGRGRARLERGILTTDTRALRPDVWRRPAEGLARLRGGGGRQLRDANAFVERSPRLPNALERVTLRDGARGSARSGATLRGGGSRDAVARPNVDIRSRDAESRVDRSRAGAVLRRPTRDDRASARPRQGATRTDQGVVRADQGGVRAGQGGVRAGQGATRARPEAVRGGGTARTGDGALRRPEATPGRARAGGGRESTAGGGGSTRPPAVRVPESRNRAGVASGRELRRPSSPVTRSRATGRASPSARSGATIPRVESRGAPASRPTVRRSGGDGGSRPTVRSSGGTSSRPTVRRSGGGSSRPPAARSSGGGSSRPTVRRSGGTSRPPAARSSGGTSRPPAARSSGGASSRPTVRRSGGGGSRPPAAGSSGGGSSRPTVRRSGGTSRPPAARSSGGGTSRPTVRRSGGTSRSGGSARSSGGRRGGGGGL